MKLSHYQNLAKTILESKHFKNRNNLADRIDMAIDGGAPLPAVIRNLPWMVEIKSTSIHDAYAAARKTLAASSVSINVLPPYGNPGTMATAKDIEDVLEFNFWLANKKTSKRPMQIIADQVARYLAVAINIVDNEHELKGQSGARVKAIKRSGRYTWKPYDIRSCYPRFSDSIMEDFLLHQCVTVQEIVDKYGKDATQEIVAKAKLGNDERTPLREIYGTLYDYWNYEDRVAWFVVGNKSTQKDTTGGGKNAVRLLNEKNKLGFIPWVYAEGDDPILKAAVETDQLKNLNVLLSMRYALIAATVAQARSWSRTASGEGVPIDYSSPDAQVQMKFGEEFGVNTPAQLDQNINTVIAEREASIANTTSVSRILSAMDSMASNTPYSTISALHQSALQSLIEVRQTAERAIEEGLCHELYWMKYTNVGMNGQRMKNKSMYDDSQRLGAQVGISSEIEPSDWVVTVQLRPNSPSDRQERLNFAINAQEKLQLSRASAFETAGIEDDPAVSLAEWADDQIKIADVQAEVKRRLLAPDMEMQQAQMAQQQKAAQEGSMGQTPATGGPPAAIQDPSATREAVTGRTQAGFEG